MIPSLPLLPTGALPPAIAVLRWLASLPPSSTVEIPLLPQLNAGLPDLLALGGIAQISGPEMPAPPFRWHGAVGEVAAGGHVVAHGASHRGSLPGGESLVGDDSGLLGLLDLARLGDASAVVDGEDGANWAPIVSVMTGRQTAPRLAPMAGRHGASDQRVLGAWNPLPFPRTAVVSLQVGTAKPWAFATDDGAVHPTQMVEGTDGPEMIVALPLAALAASGLTPIDDPVAGVHWEVSETVLDNGRVRAEFAPDGGLVRLCVDGVFAEPSSPLLRAVHAGSPLTGAVRIEIAESGPVRARLVMTREVDRGLLRITCSLHAHESCLRISVLWTGSGSVWIEHPTRHQTAGLVLAGETSPTHQVQMARITDPGGGSIAGVRWAVLADPGGRGLAVVAGRGQTCEVRDGVLSISAGPLASYALSMGGPQSGPDLARLAQHLATPLRSSTVDQARPAPFRLQGSGLVPLWVSRPAGCLGELLLADFSLTRGRLFMTTSHGEHLDKIDARGNVLAPMTRNPDGEWVIDHQPGEILLVRWR